jgi:predicted enzyme related to lactoylglutathione lyase
MSEVKTYAPGQFCWADLATTDPAGAKRFYGELLGWKMDDVPMPQGGAYSMAMISGQSVAAIAEQMADEKKMHVPPHWNCYINVANVDETTKKAASLGAKTLAPPMDVMDVGRMAVLADPSGAAFCLWQAKKHIGAGRAQEPGTAAWFELASRNVDAAGGFYSKLFGWKASTQNMGNMQYTVFAEGNNQRAGMMAMPPNVPAQVPSNWCVYFNVANCDAAVKKAESMKGKTMVPAQDVKDVGRFAMMLDPQGAMFAMLQPSR